jgi:hypothetical protein
MRSAIYYPHTKIRSASLLKSALLLWDEVHIIVPWEWYAIDPSSPDQAAAFEIIGRKLHPSREQKEQVHEIIEDFVRRPLPKGFFLSPEGGDHEYEMFAHKLLPETWEVLRRSNGARPTRGRLSHFSATAAMGLALMNILADCCAGNVFARITDRSDAYASLAGLFSEQDADHMGNIRDELLFEFEHAGDREVIVPIATETVDADSLTLEQLIALRHQEAKSSGYALRDLRHRFAERIDIEVKALSVVTTEAEREELKRQFHEEMRDDYAALRDTLRLEANQVLGMKEIVATALIPIGQFVPQLLGVNDGAHALTLTATAIAVGGLYSAKSKFAQSRRKILAEHPIAYLYEARGGLRI